MSGFLFFVPFFAMESCFVLSLFFFFLLEISDIISKGVGLDFCTEKKRAVGRGGGRWDLA